MKKIIWVIGVLAVIFGVLGIIFGSYPKNPGAFGSASTVNTSASSTVFTLTTSSQRLLATSTKRVAFSIQSVGCTVSSSRVHLNFNKDIAATTATGPIVFSTSTLPFIDDADLPVSENAVQGITDAGTCTVVVTEWRESI